MEVTSLQRMQKNTKVVGTSALWFGMGGVHEKLDLAQIGHTPS